MTSSKPDFEIKSADGFLRKIFFMTLVVLLVYIILGIAGFFLWFAFPVEKINGLTYLKGNNLIYYYIIINLQDIIGVLFFSHFVYYRYINTSSPIKDGLLLGLYLIIASWFIDLIIYVFIRKTLPSAEEYFLGKNQPEIGIAWLFAFISALFSGWLHRENKKFIRKVRYPRLIFIFILLTISSVIITTIAILFFDIKP
jgi:hypothetical protein